MTVNCEVESLQKGKVIIKYIIPAYCLEGQRKSLENHNKQASRDAEIQDPNLQSRSSYPCNRPWRPIGL
jgi:hypothetical protein